MPGRIKNNFRVLLAKKAAREQKNIPLNQVKIDTGIAWGTLQSWANNKVTRFDEPVIIALCDYLDCDIADLFVYQREE